MRLLLTSIFLFTTLFAFSSNDIILLENSSQDFVLIPHRKIDTNENINKTKVIAVTLAVTLGVFGVHRLYLGTKPLVPIAYTLTLGGGMGILPLVDIFYIISAKNINQLTNNDFIFMWNKKKSSR